MTTNQIAYQSMLAKQKEADAKVGEASARARLLEQQRDTEQYKTGLTKLDYLQEKEIKGDEEERKYYSAMETANRFWEGILPYLKFSSSISRRVN